jgi:hypothetical protein
MMWLVLFVCAFVVVLRLARRRRALSVVDRSQPMSTIHGGMSKRQSAKTRAALDAATACLR